MHDKEQKKDSNSPSSVAEHAIAKAAQGDFVRKIAQKVKGAENILIVMSKTPSVDEIAAAVGLARQLEIDQKHTTVIYSGQIPPSLDFLHPQDIFMTNTASLQDLIVQLDRNKADHLRYKQEGDFVRIYITPYKSELTEADLSFVKGDYNVDFVIAINVNSAGDLDPALKEYGRVIGDASIVNITTGNPGRFGEIEWANQSASSLSEMVTELIFEMKGGDDVKLPSDIATALLTGIVAATERFSNNRTNSETLSLASKLMSMGADQQLISANVMANNLTEQAQVETPEMDPITKARLEAQAQAKDDIAQGRPIGNPAAQIAQQMTTPQGPTPANIEIPGTGNTPSTPSSNNPMAPGSVGAPRAAEVPVADPAARQIAATMPLNTSSAVVTPTMGSGYTPPVPTTTVGSATPNLDMRTSTNGAGANTVPVLPQVQGYEPSPSLAQGREMATSAPAIPTRPQQGMRVMPPAPKAEIDYGSLMEQALAEPAPENAPKQPEMRTGDANPSSFNIPAAPTAAEAPVTRPLSNPNTFSIPSSATPPGPSTSGFASSSNSPSTSAFTGSPTSPSATPPVNTGTSTSAGSILPPPPAPPTGGMMPPR